MKESLKLKRENLFRAGICKTRTRPGGSEDIGSMVLPWLVRVKETGMLTATEVANVWHIREALK